MDTSPSFFSGVQGSALDQTTKASPWSENLQTFFGLDTNCFFKPPEKKTKKSSFESCPFWSAGECLCKEAVMITVRLQCLVLRRYGVEDANWSHPIFQPVTSAATILAARNFFPLPRPRGLVRARRWCCEKLLGAQTLHIVRRK